MSCKALHSLVLMVLVFSATEFSITRQADPTTFTGHVPVAMIGYRGRHLVCNPMPRLDCLSYKTLFTHLCPSPCVEWLEYDYSEDFPIREATMSS